LRLYRSIPVGQRRQGTSAGSNRSTSMDAAQTPPAN
jgi:hypothetical protein